MGLELWVSEFGVCGKCWDRRKYRSGVLIVCGFMWRSSLDEVVAYGTLVRIEDSHGRFDY